MPQQAVVQGGRIVALGFDQANPPPPSFEIVAVSDGAVVGELIAPAVPLAVSPYQAREALRLAGMLGQVEAAVAVAEPSVRLAWEYGLEVRRDSLFIAAMAQALGLTAEQLDAVFVTAERIAG